MGGAQVVSIIDADMVIRADFYLRMLPYLQTERDALVLAPQVRCFPALFGPFPWYAPAITGSICSCMWPWLARHVRTFLWVASDLVHAPAQEFHNYNPATDIFCHSNRLFWDVTCPGIVDGFGGVMCTGTNYVVRSRALLKARFKSCRSANRQPAPAAHT